MSDDKEKAKPSMKKNTASKKTVSKSPVSKATVTKATAATAKAAASDESDMKHAARKISDLDKMAADNTVKSKSSDNLKARASEAKQRAQKKILEEAYVSDKPTDPLERLANTFDNSARRWEMVVYPSLFAFVLLAGYGFFLIYRLTHDISTLSQSVTRMAVIVSDAMPRMTKDLNSMTGNIGGMTTEIESMSTQMNSLTPMSKNIQSMTHNIGSMNNSVYGMQRDMHGMNRTVSSGPFGMMNDIMPFSSSTNVPQPIGQRPVWPSYNPVPPQVPMRVYNQPVKQPVAKVSSKPVTVKNTAPVNVSQGNVAKQVKVPGASPVSLKN
jgi:methyl-accepting chemotaxis protein